MPKSERWRKAGGKAVFHQGRGPREDVWTAEAAARHRVIHPHTEACRKRLQAEGGGNPHAVTELRITLHVLAFDMTTKRLLPVNLEAVWASFADPRGLHEGEAPRTPEDFQAALDLLVSWGMAEVADGLVRIPARFHPT
jgi:hypothetical protein